MKRLVAFLVFCLVFLPLFAVSPLLTLENEQIASPAGVGASAPDLSEAPDGRVCLAWRAHGPNNTPAQHRAEYDPKTHAWSSPDPVASGSGFSPTAPESTEPTAVTYAGRMAKAWYEADKKDPRVLVSTSANAGGQFLMPLRVEDTRPIGAPDLVLLADGTVFVSWPEHYNQNENALWLRRISPGGSLSVPVLLAVLPAGQPKPKLARVKDNDATPAQLLLAYAIGNGDTAQIVTRLLTIAPPETVNKAKSCNCPDDDEAARGYALKGRIVSLVPARDALVVQHDEISGVLPAATTEFKTDSSVLKFATVGNDVFARVEKRGDQWWLFSARLILRPQNPSTHQP